MKPRRDSGPRRRSRMPGDHAGRDSRRECGDERRWRGHDAEARIRDDAPRHRASRPGSTGRRPGRTRKEVSGHSEEEERRQEEGGKDEEGEEIGPLSLNWLARGEDVTPLLLSAAK